MNNVYHVIKDPVHGTMQFTTTEDKWVKPFIDSPNFQRLRYVKQLGLGDFIFPGAVHSRFNHSLGCCYLGSQIAQKIGLAEEERQLVMIACLLHDIGHGPFSHAFEGIFINKLILHEDWTPYFLADYRTNEFFETYNEMNPGYHLTTEKFQYIENMIMHRPVVKRVLADIVSSQLDADRLDYLLRDSHFCGVRYGEFDFHWMLHCLAIVESKNGKRLGITHKGTGVVEHYLMARRLMTRNIYHSQKKLALECLLVRLLAELAHNLLDYPLFTAIRQTRLGQFLVAAHLFNQGLGSSVDQETYKRAFLHANYRNYRELVDDDVFSLIKNLSSSSDSHAAVQIAKRLWQRKMPKILRLDQMDLKQIEQELSEFKLNYPQYADWQLLLIQTPHRSYSGEDDPIWVVNEHGQVKSIGSYSIMIHAISDKLEHTAFLAIDKMIVDDKPIIILIEKLTSIQEIKP
ncbi:MAG: hypothetical protein A3F11_00905 [Gammaproteobacteria bacterium RIFCSPHIGHO2_12_FULL_37_14]|nr:MAG: hypothetical protein A3F11_00905 [Gammaproteobacteria bacterium RIFCSPHIGHO2_12_FULL_37_14]